METALSTIEAWKNPQIFFERILRETVTKTFLNPSPLKVIKKLVPILKKRFPDVFTFTLIDGNGLPVSELCDSLAPKKLLNRFFFAYRDAVNGKLEGLKLGKSIFRSFFGPLVKIDRVLEEDLQPASNRTSKAFVFISHPYPGGMLIAHLNQAPGWDAMGIEDRIKALQSRNKNYIVGSIDSREPVSRQILKFGAASPNVATVLSWFSRFPKNYMEFDSYCWAQRLIKPGVKLLIAAPRISNTHIHRSRKLLVFFSVLFFSVLSILTMKVMNRDLPIYFSIRLKLVFLFLYSAGIPLAIMGITARNYLVEKRSVLENEVHVENEKALRTFDSQFLESIGELEKGLRNFFKKPFSAGVKPVEGMENRLMEAIEKFSPKTCELVDEKGQQLFSKGGQTLMGSFSGPMAKKVLSRFFKNLNAGERKSEGEVSLQEEAVSSLAEAGGIDIEAFFTLLYNSLGTIGEFKFGLVKYLVFLHPMYDLKGIARNLVILGWDRDRNERFYVRERLKSTAGRLSETALYAPCRRLMSWSVPRKFRHEKLLQPFIHKLRSRSQNAFGVVETGNNRFLLTGIRGAELRDFDLIAMTSDRKIREELFSIRMRLGLISFAIFVISLTVGGLLAKKFLEPVTHLSSGVSAIRKRNFDLRIPVLDMDELGDLSETFNEMMGGLEDLEVARIVQESLFPAGVLKLNRCIVFGSCLPATEVGGDYFDYFPLSDGRLAVIIGDVSGHGIAAALVMGMAKALVAQLTGTVPNPPPVGESKWVDPAAILHQMNQIFERILKRKKMMTCLISFFDFEKMEIIYSNAGQNFPFLYRKGNGSFFETGSYPLGISKRQQYHNKKLNLEADDWFLFYTDGLVEAGTPQGGQLGYSIFKTIPAFMDPDPIETEKRIRRWHAGVVKPGPQEDDITIVVVQILPDLK